MKLFIGSLVITLISYFKLFNGFFQQDEWLGYSEYILRINFNFNELLKYFFAPSVSHYTPFTLMVLYLNLRLFGMNYFAHIVISLLLHILVITCVFVLMKKLYRSNFFAGVGTLLFATFSSGQQATSWVMADIGTHGATIFGILSIVYFLNFLEIKSHKLFFNSLLFLLISLFFKEITIGIFIIMLFLLWSNKKINKIVKKVYFNRIILICLTYVCIKILMIVLALGDDTYGKLVFESQSYSKLVYDFVTIPIKAISQTIIPIEIMRHLSEFIAKLFPESVAYKLGSPDFESFVVKRVLEVVSLVVSLIIGFWVSISKNRSQLSVLGLIWIVINSFIFAFSPQRNGITSVLDSRNLYFISIGASLILTTFFLKIWKKRKNWAFLYLLIIIIPNLFYLNQKLSDLVKVGSLRKNILNQINELYPRLPIKVVIYTQSNQSYYGLPNEVKIMPFQSGFGQTLLMLYHPMNKFPKEIIEGRFLWDIKSQGYKEVDGVGFGYYRDLDLLIKTVKQYNLPRESIIGFNWDGRKNVIKDISEEIRSKINDGKN